MQDKDSPARYRDIIDLPRPISPRHPPIPNGDRAAQFAPFAALTGHESAIREAGRVTQPPAELTEERKEELDRTLRTLLSFPTPPLVTITHFVPDAKKAGGAYVSTTGHIVTLDGTGVCLILSDTRRIPLDAVRDIQLCP